MMARLAHGDIRRGRTVALYAAELELPALANIGVIGINGAGKSTLMHALAGCLRPGAGTIMLRLSAPDRAPERFAYSPQQPAFPGWLRVEEVLMLYGLELRALEQMLPELLLDELRGGSIAALSVGQRQALSVAISIALAAPVTMLDEPFASVDFRRRVGLIQVLRRCAGSGFVLVSSQNAADLLETCSWLLVLRAGRYVFSGPTGELAGATSDATRALRNLEDGVLQLLGATAVLPRPE